MLDIQLPFEQNGHTKNKRNTGDKVTVSVIIPTLNEADNLPLVLPYIPLHIVDEVILVDGRSTDKTIEVARQLLPSIKVVIETKPGKGAAMRRGYHEASGDILIVLDADGSNDPREIPRFVRALLEGADFAKGSRFAPMGGTSDMPRYRKLGNQFFVILSNILFGSTFTDLCYGYHAFWRYCLDVMDLEDIDGFEIDTAIYLKALRERLRIVDVPSFEGYRFHGIGKLQTIPDGWRVLRTIFSEYYKLITSSPKPEFQGFRNTAMLASLDLNVVINNPAAYRLKSDLRLIYALNPGLTTLMSFSNIMQQILQTSVRTVKATSGSILILDENGNAVDSCSTYDGSLQSLPPDTLQKALEEGLAGWSVQNRQPALVANTAKDSRWYNQSWEEAENVSRSALAVPLMNCDRVVGVLTLVRNNPEHFTEEDLELVSDLVVSG